MHFKAMLGNAVLIATICTLSFAILGEAGRVEGAAGSKGTAEGSGKASRFQIPAFSKGPAADPGEASRVEDAPDPEGAAEVHSEGSKYHIPSFPKGPAKDLGDASGVEDARVEPAEDLGDASGASGRPGRQRSRGCKRPAADLGARASGVEDAGAEPAAKEKKNLDENQEHKEDLVAGVENLVADFGAKEPKLSRKDKKEQKKREHALHKKLEHFKKELFTPSGGPQRNWVRLPQRRNWVRRPFQYSSRGWAAEKNHNELRWAAEELGPAAIPVLVKIFEDEKVDEEFHDRAFHTFNTISHLKGNENFNQEALGKGLQAAIPSLVVTLKNENNDKGRRERAALMLKSIGEQHRRAKGPNRDTKDLAPGAFDGALADCIRSPSDSLRAAARAACGTLGSPPLCKAASDEYWLAVQDAKLQARRMQKLQVDCGALRGHVTKHCLAKKVLEKDFSECAKAYQKAQGC